MDLSHRIGSEIRDSARTAEDGPRRQGWEMVAEFQQAV